MNESLKKFKNKIYKEVIIKSLLISLSFSIIVFSITLILCKVNAIYLHPMIYVLLFLGIAVLSFLSLYFILRPNKIKLAKRVDESLNLNEKVQTMVAFEDKTGIMVELQREDTSNKLNSISTKRLPFKFNIFHFIIPVVACAMCVTSLVIPTKAKVSEPNTPLDPDDPFESREDMFIDLRNLIKEVKASDINEDIKNDFVEKLTQLLNDLFNISTQNEKNTRVLNTISETNQIVEVYNSNKRIYQILTNSSDTNVKVLASSISSLDEEGVAKMLDELKDSLGNVESSTSLSEIHNSFGKLLEDSTIEKDELVSRLIELSSSLNSIDENEEKEERINSIFAESKPKIMDIVLNQSKNKKVGNRIEDKLREIFGLPKREDPEHPLENPENPNGSKDDPDDEKPEEKPTGGIGSGEILFGSDDVFFDPELGFIKYSDVIYEYHGDILALIRDGVIPKEYEAYINQYFQILFGGESQEKD